MRNLLAALLLSLVFISCKKEEQETLNIRCGTVSPEPLWAKNFVADSLYKIRFVSYVRFHRRTPGNIMWDTAYTTAIPIRFLPNGIVELNGSSACSYTIKRVGPTPQLVLYNIQNLLPIYPYSNSFLNASIITMSIEYFNSRYDFTFDNKVSYYSTSEVHENSDIIVTP